MVLQTGQILNNRYRIVNLLGQGGFGAVYRVWDINLESPRALKENLDTSQEAQKQFKLEAILLSQLKHQNLPNVIDHFIVPNQGQYLVMEYVEGEDLQQMLDKQGGPLPESQVLPWIEQVCEALGYLHSQNPPIIHRDIKPANIKITPKGIAVLVDFGIAKVFDPLLSTTVGARAVTPGYSPHEQYGQGKTDPRTDIYALGATLYTLLTGQVPVESIQRMITDPLIPAAKVNPAISPAVADAIQQAMQNDPNQRPSSTKAFKDTLQAPAPIVPTLPLSKPIPTQVVPSQATQASPSPTFNLQPLKRWLPWVASVIAVVILAVVFWPDGEEPAVEETKAVAAQVMDAETPTLTATETPSAIPSDPPSPSETATATPPPSLTPTPRLDIGSTQVSTQDNMVMVYIPAGEFQMGSEDRDNEKPVHSVSLDAYWMDQHEVTNAMYQLCVSAGACDPPTYTEYFNNASYSNHPVVYVSWYQAVNYCEWAGRRLPTEAEWEKAARGRLEGAKYPWGNEDPVCRPGARNGAQYSTCDGDTVPVMTFAANGYGLFDMAGNVWEWINDWYSSTYYSGSPSSNPPGPTTGDDKGLRGGGWYGSDHYLRVADRNFNNPDFSDYVIGFRCVSAPGQ